MMKDVQTINKYIDAGFLMARKETTNGTRGYFMFTMFDILLYGRDIENYHIQIQERVLKKRER